MKLALVRNHAKADIIMDEPTNHLDVINVQWVFYINFAGRNLFDGFPDTSFLDKLWILSTQDLKLHTYKGNVSAVAKDSLKQNRTLSLDQPI